MFSGDVQFAPGTSLGKIRDAALPPGCESAQSEESMFSFQLDLILDPRLWEWSFRSGSVGETSDIETGIGFMFGPIGMRFSLYWRLS